MSDIKADAVKAAFEAEAAMHDLLVTARDLAANLMRVIAGAGRVAEAVHQAQAFVDAWAGVRGAPDPFDGALPPLVELGADLAAETTGSEPDPEDLSVREKAVVVAALRVAAARLKCQPSLAKQALSQLYAAAAELDK